MTDVKNIFLVVGTRPEAIKMAPVYHALKSVKGLRPRLLLTGQHREQLAQALSLFKIEADLNLDVMVERQGLPELAATMLPRIARTLKDLDADYVLVHGDTLTTFVAAWAAFLEGIPVGHVEAGLRSGSIAEPFPEEANRKLTGVITDLDFAPTEAAKENLLKEGKAERNILVTGQTGVDAILMASRIGELPEDFPKENLVTVTLHRRENWPILKDLARGLANLAERFPKFHFVYPVHLNPFVREAVRPGLSEVKNFYLLDPLPYGPMAALLSRSRLIITDSGGLQEEGVSLGVPVGVVRNVTERPEGLSSGLLTLLGTAPDRMVEGASRLLEETAMGGKPCKINSNPYGDGKAAERIAEALLWRFGEGSRPENWN